AIAELAHDGNRELIFLFGPADFKEMGMRAGIHEQASGAAIASIKWRAEPGNGPVAFAQERLGEFDGEAAFADAGRPDEEIGMREAMAGDDLAKGVDAISVTKQLGPGHWLYTGGI